MASLSQNMITLFVKNDTSIELVFSILVEDRGIKCIICLWFITYVSSIEHTIIMSMSPLTRIMVTLQNYFLIHSNIFIEIIVSPVAKIL